MRVVIDGDLCQGHQMCAIQSPELFGADDEGYGTVLVTGDLTAEQLEAARHAVESCPEEAISVVD